MASLPLNPMTFGWFLKRAAIGLTLLVLFVGTMAWLTYVSLDDVDEAAAATTTGSISPADGR